MSQSIENWAERVCAGDVRALTDEAAGVEMTVWLIDYDGTIANQAPDEHDELRWLTLDEIAGLALALPSYVELLDRAAHV